MQITFRKIVLSVAGVHLAGLILLAFWGLLSPQPAKPQKLRVNTVVFRQTQPQSIKSSPIVEPPPQEEIAMVEPTQEEEVVVLTPEPEPVISEPEPLVSKEPVKEATKTTKTQKQIAKKPVEIPKKPAAKKQTVKNQKKENPAPPPKKPVETAKVDPKIAAQKRALLLEAKKRLNSSSSSSKESPKIGIELPGEISPLSIETLVLGTTSKDAGYVDLLISRLKAQLSLPEIGEVKLFLTLNREGKVVEVNVSHTPSRANKSYIEKTLPKISFSGFGSYFEGEENHKFDITLRGG